MVDRNYIINRVKSKSMTKDEFNFEKLVAPPMMSLFTPYDIDHLYNIAHSIRYSANLPLKYKEIDKVMRARGFEKFIGGTNRITYRCIENNSIIVKVAIDDIGRRDNPAEFKNQMLFKPFVTKVFEVSPCGTVGIFERVKPITNREEFLTVADDVYTVINEIFVGEYVLADIGTSFFMNWALRENFGPVLCDFPYAYKLDGKKLFCNAPDPTSPTGCCEGVIDYDMGYNFLKCTKCGCQYRAIDLAQSGETRKIIVKQTGGIKMKFSVKGGTNNTEKNITLNEDAENSKVIPAASPKKVEVTTAPREEVKVEDKTDEEKKRANAQKPVAFVSEEDTVGNFQKITDLVNEIRKLSGFLTDDESQDAVDMLNDLAKEINREIPTSDEAAVFKEDIEEAYEIISKANKTDAKDMLNNCDIIVDLVSENLDFFKDNIAAISDEERPEDTYEDVNEDDVEDTNEDAGPMYNNIVYLRSKVTNVHDIDPTLESKKVIVMVDDDDNFIVTGNKEIITIDQVNGKSIDSLSIVSSKWLDSINAQLSSLENNENSEDDEEDTDINIVEPELKEIPTGVLPESVEE